MSSSGVLETRIRAILQSTPLERFNTISAKDVRTRLLADGAVDEAWVKQNKKALNALIAGVFEQVSASLVLPPPPPQQTSADGDDDVQPKEEEEEEEYGYANGEAYSEQSQSRNSDYVDDDNDEGEEGAGPSTPPRKSSSHKKKTKRELTDEELARQLSTELNGRASRSSRSGKVPPKSKTRNNNKKGGSRTPKRGKKSADYVDDSDGGGGGIGGRGGGGRRGRGPSDSDADSDNDDYGDSDGGQQRMLKTNKRRKTTRKSSGGGEVGGGSGGRAKGGFGKEFILSAPLSALLEVDRLSRPQVVKQLWEYIKGNDLQNPSNRREILCDDRLRPVFNADKIDMFKMNKVLGQHLHEVE